MTLDPSTSRALTQRLAEEQSTCRLPSIAAATVRDGEVVWSDAIGAVDGRAGGPSATTDTQYRIGSITKTFVAVEILRLRDEGLLDLGGQVGAVLPEVSFPQITIAQLLTHTSGLQAESNGEWWERTKGGTWEALLSSGVGLRSTSGTTFHYSNVGYAVLGEIVARLRGVPWSDAIRTGILQPLGMTRTTTRPDSAAPGFAVHPLADLLHVEPEHDAGALAPAGQLWSTVEDLAVWAAFLGGRTGDVLAAESLAEMLRPVAVNDSPGNAWMGAHALGWEMWNVDGRRFAGHGGSMPGFLATLRVDLETGDGVVLMTNSTSGLGTATTDLLSLLTEREPLKPKVWSADASQSSHLDLVGRWYWGTYEFRLSLATDGALVLGELGTGRGARFKVEGDGWTGLDGYYKDEPLVDERDESGQVSRLVLASFVFTRTPYDSAAEVPGGVDPAGWS